MTNQEERERALDLAFRDVVEIPRVEYDRLRRALLELMRGPMGYNEDALPVTKQEERERALGRILALPLEMHGTTAVHDAIRLQGCVPVERAEYERLRRFVVEVMKDMGLGTFGIYHCHDDTGFDMLVEMGFIEARENNKITTWWWTDAAHEFARSMREKGGEGA